MDRLFALIRELKASLRGGGAVSWHAGTVPMPETNADSEGLLLRLDVFTDEDDRHFSKDTYVADVALVYASEHMEQAVGKMFDEMRGSLRDAGLLEEAP